MRSSKKREGEFSSDHPKLTSAIIRRCAAQGVALLDSLSSLSNHLAVRFSSDQQGARGHPIQSSDNDLAASIQSSPTSVAPLRTACFTDNKDCATSAREAASAFHHRRRLWVLDNWRVLPL